VTGKTALEAIGGRPRRRKPPTAPETAAATPAEPLPALTPIEEQRVQAWAERRRAHEATRGKPRVKVERIGPKTAVTMPPDGVHQAVMQADLMRAFGTTDTEFLSRTWNQLNNSVAGGSKTVSDTQYNGLLASMAGIEPRDEIEAMLATQMIAAQDATMTLMRQLANAETIVQRDTAGRLAQGFMKIFTAQIEALRRHRSPGEQRVVVQHVHVTAEQAAVQVNGGEGPSPKAEDPAHAPTARRTLAHAPGAPMPSPDAAREPLPVAGRSR
jgi:hypothetical protein